MHARYKEHDHRLLLASNTIAMPRTSDRRVVLSEMRAAALLVCCLLFAGRLAAASKTFGGGGYGGEEGGQQQVEGAASSAADATAAKDESYGTVTPTTPEAEASSSTESARPRAQPYTPTSDGQQDGGQTSAEESSSTASAGQDQGYGGGGGGQQDEGQTSGEESSSTPSAGTEEASASPATDQGYGGGGQASASSSSEPLNGLNQKAINDIINEHNVFRAKEHVPPLKWNETLAKFSQQYAETLKADCKMVHSTSPYGENLMLGSGAISWKTTVDEWSAEKKNYNYGANTCEPGKMCGHYTAVVWKDTTSVGCGRVLCNNGDTMILCSYWPPGNYDGVKPY